MSLVHERELIHTRYDNGHPDTHTYSPHTPSTLTVVETTIQNTSRVRLLALSRYDQRAAGHGYPVDTSISSSLSTSNQFSTAITHDLGRTN